MPGSPRIERAAMNWRRSALVVIAVAVSAGSVWAVRYVWQTTEAEALAPRFEVDPFWPKPLPDNWRLGSSIGVAVDSEDVVWMLHRGSSTLNRNERALELDPPEGTCCRAAPPVLAFDQEGNLVQAWGGPGAGYDWPESNHGIHVDDNGFVWIAGNGDRDSHILKFTKDGSFVAQFGSPTARTPQVVRQGGDTSYGGTTYLANSHDPENFAEPTKIWVDAEANETYVADGYVNRRVAVLDAETGEMRRYWGAYGNRPDDEYQFDPPGRDEQNPPTQFRGPVHCVTIANDGRVYVCDRAGNRLQVFTKAGEFLEEAFFEPTTLRSGAVWDIAISTDADQRYLFIADGVNEKIRIVDRESLQELTNFGAGGRQPGQFYGVHNVAIDSSGNLYTTETYEGKRLQRFLFRGIGPIQSREQGPPWPTQDQPK
jgi:DNA-binding beta-propeller fold protein YncE